MTVDELQDYGVAAMSDDEIDRFLSTRGFGVLGLPTDGAPYLLPLSFGYDGDATLYFSYVVAEASRKVDLSERADTASFLVYKADSAFSWQSVLLTGHLDSVEPDDLDDPQTALENAWNLDVFEGAEVPGTLATYRFAVEDRSGIKHHGLPPGFEERTA